MAINEITRIANRFVSIWVILNIVMIPVYAADRLSWEASLVSSELKSENLIENGLSSKVTPLDNDVDNKHHGFSYVYLIYLICLVLLGLLFRFENKKSQIALFIIYGIIILTAIGVTIYIYAMSKEMAATEMYKTQIVDTKITPVRIYIENCIDRVGYEGFKKIGLQGGYIDIPDYIKYQDTSFWYLNEKNIQPLLNETRTRLTSYVNNHLKDCLTFSQYSSEEGFSITYGSVSSEVTYGIDDATLRVFFPVLIKYKEVEQSYDEFIIRYDIRFRKIWELASKYENKFFDPDFDHNKPLEGVNTADFTVSTEPTSDGKYIVYRIEDKQNYVFGENNYTFRFAFKNGPSTLTRSVDLQPNCYFIPNYAPIVIYSADRDAELFIRPMTYLYMPKGACEITIQQSYEQSAAVPYRATQSHDGDTGLMQGFDSSAIRILTHPVYNIEPTGTIATRPMRLNLHWDGDYSPMMGPTGILAKHGDNPWKAIDSNPVYSQNYCWTELNGFTSYTLLDCGVQSTISTKTTSTLTPEWPCFLALVLLVTGLWTFGVLSLGVGGLPILAGGNVGAGIATGVGAGGGILAGGSADKDCVEFTPSCDGKVELEKEEDKGTGSCTIAPADPITNTIQTIIDAIGDITALVISIPNLIQSLSDEGGGAKSYLASYNDTGSIINDPDELGLREQPDFLTALRDTITPLNSLVTMFQPASKKLLQGGHTYSVCAKVKKCDVLTNLICQKCSITCTVTYK